MVEKGGWDCRSRSCLSIKGISYMMNLSALEAANAPPITSVQYMNHEQWVRHTQTINVPRILLIECMHP